MRHYPAVVGISPDASKLLLKSVDHEKFLLQIVTMETGHLTTINSDPDGQFSPQWSHNMGSIAYFLDPDGKQDFQLQVTDIPSLRTRAVKTERIINPRLQWSASDRYLALLSEHRHLIVIDLHHQGKVIYRSPGELQQRTNFAWSKKSDSIAFVTASEPQKIQIQNFSSGENTTVTTSGVALHMCWLNTSDKIIADVVSNGTVVIREFDANSFTTLPVALAGEITSILTTADDSRFLFTLNTGTSYRFAVFDRANSILSYKNGSVLSADRTGQNIYISIPSDSQTDIASFNLEDSASRTLFRQPSTQPSDIRPQEIDIPIAGRNVPAIIWNTREPGTPLILMVHGGPQLNYMRNWRADVETLLKNKVSVALLNYGGSSGYGEQFIAESHLAMGDVVGAIDFFSGQKRYPRLFVLGDSWGARIAVQAASLRREALAGLILYSYFGELPETSQWPEKVIAFQGENDYLCSPECASAQLQRTWKIDKHDWLVAIEREGHSFRRLDTWADVLARIIYLVNR